VLIFFIYIRHIITAYVPMLVQHTQMFLFLVRFVYFVELKLTKVQMMILFDRFCHCRENCLGNFMATS